MVFQKRCEASTTEKAMRSEPQNERRKVMVEPGACVRCGGSLETGFLEDGGESIGRTRWIPGPIEVGPLGGTVKMGKPRYEIQAARCQSCSHLELFVVNL
jgi:hypothetical protein